MITTKPLLEMTAEEVKDAFDAFCAEADEAAAWDAANAAMVDAEVRFYEEGNRS